VFSLENVSEDVAQYMKGCEYLLSALSRHTKFSESETEIISYYSQEILTHTRSLREGTEK
jgi:hypothetical protein